MATTVVAPRQVHDGFSNAPRLETPGTLLSRPFPVDPENPAIPPVNRNDSRSLGRTVTINYGNGWLIVGGEAPGSADGSDLSLRVYGISNPTQLVRMRTGRAPSPMLAPPPWPFLSPLHAPISPSARP